MKQIIIFISLILLAFSFKPALAQEKINLYFFYGDGCPHCAKEEKFLERLEQENENIVVKRYEVWHNRDNAKLLGEIAKNLNLKVSGVPLLIVGEKTIAGFYSDETTGAEIRTIVNKYTVSGCDDIVAPILGINGNQTCVHGCAEGDADCWHDCGCVADADQNNGVPDTIVVPIIGEITTKNLSLPLLTVIIGALDGFNPCAMWVLLFLISLLVGMADKKRMWLLGTTFIVTSAAVYFLFLTAWLNLFLFLGFVLWIRVMIGLVALGSGGYHLYEFYKNRDGCPVTSSESKRRILDRARRAVSEKKLWFALGGIIALAFAVNLIELVCSAGLPAVFTQVLTLAGLPAWQYYGYLLLYIFVFLLDDLLIFFAAMVTLQIKAFGLRFSHWSGLVGGLAMLLIGLLLLFKPGWLMFG